MKRLLLLTLAAIGGLTVLGVLLLLGLSWSFLRPAPVPDGVILTLSLEEGLVETRPDDPLVAVLERRQLQIRDLVGALEGAATDDRVVGLWVKGGDPPGGWALAQELREAVRDFRASGKPALLFAETFGEFSPGHGAYHLATAFDRILLQPSGEVVVGGLALEAPFLREALEKLEVEPRFDTRGEYKDAVEIFTREGFSDLSREHLTRLLESILATFREGIGEGRGLPPDSVQALLDGGPYSAIEALEAGLVDELLYLEASRTRLQEEVGANTEFLPLREYLTRGGGAWNRGAAVAVIYGVGSIHRGSSGFDPISGGGSTGSSTVGAAFRAAVEDPQIRAILFRVDSPGGSWVASDLLRQEVLNAREAGKPVVVSMGNAAASGGYLISSGADRIVAQPTTITGSIGVVAGRFVTEAFFRRYGIHWDRVQVGESTGFSMGVGDFSQGEWERFQEDLDRIYEGFLDRVAEDRGMDREALLPLAGGRIWSGRDALERGLVDELGGFSEAVGAVRELAGLDPDAAVQLVPFPAERSLFQLLLEEEWGISTLVDGLRGIAGPAPVRVLPFRIPGS